LIYGALRCSIDLLALISEKPALGAAPSQKVYIALLLFSFHPLHLTQSAARSNCLKNFDPNEYGMLLREMKWLPKTR